MKSTTLFLLVLAAFSTSVLIGCDQSGTPLKEDEGVKSAVRASQEQPDIPPSIEEVNRFKLNVDVKGPLKPNAATRIVLSATSRLPTSKAKLKLYLPEIAALKMAVPYRKGPNAKKPSQGGPIVLPVGKQIPAAINASQAVGKSQKLRRQKIIRAPEPGYYMVSAAVVAPEGNHRTEEGVPIDNATSKQFWLWIGENDGEVTQRFETDRFPDGYHVQPGPLTLARKPARLQPAHQKSAKANVRSSLSKTAGATAKANAEYPKVDENDVGMYFTYMNPISGKLEPLVGSLVQVRTVDRRSGEKSGLTQNSLDSYGGFVRSCDEQSSEEIIATMRTSGRHFSVAYDGRSSVAGRGKAYEAACGQAYETRVDASQYFVWRELYRVKSRAHFGPTRGSIGVTLDPDADGSYYGDDAIVLEEDDYDALDEYALFTIAHEYGHAYHEEAIGGYGTGGDDCPSPHYLSGPHNLGCAYSEGFANYFAAVAVVDTNSYKGVFERNGYYPGSASLGDGDPDDGSIIEGAFAAFMYDLTDPANEPHDDAEYPRDYVADVLGTCEADHAASGEIEANGVDHLIACFQHEPPPYTSKYFPTRSADFRALGYEENASEPSGWAPAAIEDLWRKNLYGENP